MKDDTKGNGGRRAVIQSKDGKFQTLYFHLKSINVKAGEEVKEGQEIGRIGASAFNSEKGTASHLHYGIKKKDSNGDLQWYNPTEGKSNIESNIVDPQSWVEGSPNMMEAQEIDGQILDNLKETVNLAISHLNGEIDDKEYTKQRRKLESSGYRLNEERKKYD